MLPSNDVIAPGGPTSKARTIRPNCLVTGRAGFQASSLSQSITVATAGRIGTCFGFTSQ